MEHFSFSLDDIAGSRFPLLEHAPDATVIVDTAGRICLINAQTERLFGYYREELIGETVEKLIPERFREKHVGARLDYLTDPCVRPMGVGLELFGRRSDGSEFPIEISLSPVRLKEGTFVASAIRDVTDRRAFEQRLRELNVELEDANRAKDRFLASMSHELRTPLNAIIGFTGTLLMGLPGPLNDEQTRQLGIVQSSARHLLSLINDVLDLSKIESGKVELTLEHVSLRALIDDIVASFSSLAAAKHLEFSATVSIDGDDAAFTDERALRQVLFNLTSNAIKYTEKGSVHIDVQRSVWREAPAFDVRVVDTGVGIRDEDLKRLFRPFEQLDPSNTRSYEGTGLGLYLSRNLSSLLGGELAVTSEYGSGSTFTLTLPREKPE